jgi:hypothetical protein
MVPVFTLAVAALRFRTRRAATAGQGEGRYFSENMVFSVHFYAFLLVYLSVATSITAVVLRSLSRYGCRPGPVAVDSVVSWITLAVLWPYLALAVRSTDTTS